MLNQIAKLKINNGRDRLTMVQALFNAGYAAMEESRPKEDGSIYEDHFIKIFEDIPEPQQIMDGRRRNSEPELDIDESNEELQCEEDQHCSEEEYTTIREKTE